jgi:hypothetical protein
MSNTLTRLPNQRIQYQGLNYKLVQINNTPVSFFRSIGMKEDFLNNLTPEELEFVSEDTIQNGPRIILRRCEADLTLSFEQLGFDESTCEWLTRIWNTEEFGGGDPKCKADVLCRCVFDNMQWAEMRAEDTNELVDFTELVLAQNQIQNGLVHIDIDSSRLSQNG